MTNFSLNKMLLYKPLNVSFINPTFAQSHIFCLEGGYLTSLIYMRNIYGILSVKRKITISVPYCEHKVKDTKNITNNYYLHKMKKVAKINT